MSGHLILLVILVTCQMVTSIPAPTIPDSNGTETKTTSTSNSQNMMSNMLEEQDYFEGDLDITEELIQAYYSNDSTDTMVRTHFSDYHVHVYYSMPQRVRIHIKKLTSY